MQDFQASLQAELLHVHCLAVDMVQQIEVLLRGVVVAEAPEQHDVQSSFVVSQGLVSKTLGARSVTLGGLQTYSQGTSDSSADNVLGLDRENIKTRSDIVASRITAGLRKQSMIRDFHTHNMRLDRSAMMWVHRLGLRMTRKSASARCFLGDWPKRVLQSGPFETVISIIILLNVILIGVSSDFDVQCSVMDMSCDSEVRGSLLLTNTAFAVIFALEVSFRILFFGWEFWFGVGWEWNLVDAVVVALSIIEEVANTGSDVLYVRVLRLFRFVRTLRVVRTFPIFHTLRTLSNAIKDSVVCFCWAMVLLCFVIFMFAAGFVPVLVDFADSGTASENHLDFLRTFFPSLSRTLLTLFMSVTGGLSWWDVESVFLDISPWLAIAFALYVSLMHLALMNIVTGVFVNGALEQSQLDRDSMAKMELDRRQADMERLRAMFAKVDSLDTGRITMGQFLEFWEMEDVKVLFAVMGLDISDAMCFFESLDVDGSRELELEEFVMGCMKLRGCAKNLDMATILRENKNIMEKLEKSTRHMERQLEQLERCFGLRVVQRTRGGTSQMKSWRGVVPTRAASFTLRDPRERTGSYASRSSTASDEHENEWKFSAL